MNIRKLTIDDTLAFRELRLKALKKHPEAFSDSYEAELERPLDYVTNRMRQTTESPDSFILAAYEGGELVGTVGFFRNQGRKVRHNGTIWGMYVAAEAQGRGIGKALLTQAIEHIRLMPGIEQVHLGVNSRNQRARNLYESLGFKIYGVEKRALQIDGEYFDIELMALRL